jgi:aminoglycoside 2''-phosphotransferase
MDTEQTAITPYRELIETCFPDIVIETCQPHLNGWDSLVLEINNTLIFRFPRPNRPDVEAQLAREIALLPELVGVLPLPIPRFDYLGEWAGRRFVGYRKLSGVEMRSDTLVPAQAKQVAQQLAAFLSCLHRFPVQRAVQLGLEDVSPSDWRQRYERLYEQMREQVFPLLEPSVRAKAAALWEGFLTSETAVAFRPTLIHRDLNDDHILYDPARGAITGIIDWGDVSIGDPAMDFAYPLKTYGPEFVSALFAGYQGEWDATFQERMRFYIAIMPLQEVLYGLLEGDESHVRNGLERFSG